jgi:hypothetical protein
MVYPRMLPKSYGRAPQGQFVVAAILDAERDASLVGGAPDEQNGEVSSPRPRAPR